MNAPTFESLEHRLLLSAEFLAAGKAAFFDINGDGTNDAILVNNGSSSIEYKYISGSGLDSVKLTADGGKFTTNTWVAHVGDTNPDDDYSMGSSKLGVDVNYRGALFSAVAGDSSVIEGAIPQLEIGHGNLVSVKSTEGAIGKVYVRDGDLTDATSAAAIDTLLVNGDILDVVSAASGINRIAASRIDGGQIRSGSGSLNQLAVQSIDGGSILDVLSLGTLTADVIGGQSQITTQLDIVKLQAGEIADASITTGGGIGKLVVDTLSGTPTGTNVSIGTHVGTFQAQTVTGGLNSTLYLTFGAGVDKMIVGQMDGGQATDGGFSGAFIAVNGNIASLRAGLITGGSADGVGSYAMLNFTVSPYTAEDGTFQAGDILYMNAAGITGGLSVNGGDAMLNFTVGHDLVDARIGQMIGHGNVQPISDPSVYLNIGHDIISLVVGQISAGNATGEHAYASVNITAGNDIASLTAGRIDAGSAEGLGSLAEVYVTAGRDIKSITSRSFSGGQATGTGAMAGLYIEAARNIDFIGASLISGTQAAVPIQDPTVHFVAGGDIGTVMAGRITGGTVTSDGVSTAKASVLVQANGTYGAYVDENGQIRGQGNIGQIVSGTIDGGLASGADALSYVKISAANDIDKLYADHIFGGQSENGGFAYVSILAEHDINDIQCGVISGETNAGLGGDPAVVIRAYNDIKSLVANRIIAGPNGNVSIIAGMDENGNLTGELDADGNLVAGSIESLVVGLISGNGGIVNIAAGGSIDNLTACRVISGDGEVNIVAGGDITASVGSVRSWSLQGDTGVTFVAGGAVNDVKNTIKDEYTHEGMGQTVVIPELPE